MADKTNRRDFLKAAAMTSLVAPYLGATNAEASPAKPSGASQRSMEPSRRPGEVERWGVYEAAFKSETKSSNPFTDVTLKAHFQCNGTKITVNGFYDGEDTWRIRLMPTVEGPWKYVTESNNRDLDGKKGSFQCVAPSPDNHGPVRVAKQVQFSYADGTPFFPLGTTLYNWVHRGRAMQEETLATLRANPFTKVRFMVFPKWYIYNRVEPPTFPYVKNADGTFDYMRFDPAYFQNIERCVRDLNALGIQADLILFDPYNKPDWGFGKMSPEQDDAYLRYIVTRLAPYRNVWWTMANEFDFIHPAKNWDHIFQTVQALDPYNHLRGIHNGRVWYDHSKPWVTHVEIQHDYHTYKVALDAREKYNKPVIIEEYGYEGNNGANWGNKSGRQEMHNHWGLTMAGAYGSHGETYVHPGDILWWAVGGKLVGESPSRLGFLKKIMTEGPYQDLEPAPSIIQNGLALAKKGEYYLVYFPEQEIKQNAELQLDGPGPFEVELIDPWLMQIYKLGLAKAGRHSFRAKCTPGLLRLTRATQTGAAVAHSLEEILWKPEGMWESGLVQGPDFLYEQQS